MKHIAPSLVSFWETDHLWPGNSCMCLLWQIKPRNIRGITCIIFGTELYKAIFSFFWFPLSLRKIILIVMFLCHLTTSKVSVITMYIANSSLCIRCDLYVDFRTELIIYENKDNNNSVSPLWWCRTEQEGNATGEKFILSPWHWSTVTRIRMTWCRKLSLVVILHETFTLSCLFTMYMLYIYLIYCLVHFIFVSEQNVLGHSNVIWLYISKIVNIKEWRISLWWLKVI